MHWCKTAPARAARSGRGSWPGKADFLVLVDVVGTIAGADRAMEISYKKSRTLIDELNGAFRAPVVETVVGGRTRLTPLGVEVLARYRSIERRVAKAAKVDLDGLAALGKPADAAKR